jgi:aryl carrier-like protein
MIPARATFLDSLPLNANGKVDRLALQRLDPDDVALVDATPAHTLLEQLLLEHWRTQLGLRQAGVHADFFALGGSSLQATALVNRLQPLFGHDLTVASLFEAPTVAEFAALLVARQPELDTVLQELATCAVEKERPL